MNNSKKSNTSGIYTITHIASSRVYVGQSCNLEKQPGDLVVDPFGGSFTTAKACEELGRQWVSTELMGEYVAGGASRFHSTAGFENHMIN